jgi:hypothetical protein
MNEPSNIPTEPLPPGTLSPLDPLPDESPAAYEAFLCYIEGGERNRSVKTLAQDLGGSEHTYAEWCTKFQWRTRRRAYFAGLARKRVQAESGADQDESLARAQFRERIEKQLDEVLQRLTESSLNLLEHKLNHQSEDFKIPHILRMIRTVADQLARTKRPAIPPGSSNSPLRKELLAVAEFARQQSKLKTNYTPSDSNGSASIAETVPQPIPDAAK